MPTFKAIGADPITYNPRPKVVAPPKINYGIGATGGQIFNQPITGADSTTEDPTLAGANLTGAPGFKSMLPASPAPAPTGEIGHEWRDGNHFTRVPGGEWVQDPQSGGNMKTADEIGGGTGLQNYAGADTKSIDARINALLGRDPEKEIQDRLARESAAIDAEYTQRTLDEQAASRNRMGDQFGSLANLMVNPLSSGAANVARGEDISYQKLLQNLDLNRALLKKSAEANIRGEVGTSFANQIKSARDERSALQTDAQQKVENQRAALQDNISVINNAVAVAKSKRDATNQERDDAYNAYQKQITALGSKAFEGVADADIKAFEKTAGLPAGFIKKNTETLKQQEIANRYGKPELKEVGGSLYSLVWDPATGQYKKQTVIQKPVSGGAGAGSSYDTILAKLKASGGAGALGVDAGYADVGEYNRLRMATKDKASFDKAFSSLLDPADRAAQTFMSKETEASALKQARADLADSIYNTEATTQELIRMYPELDPFEISKLKAQKDNQ